MNTPSFNPLFSLKFLTSVPAWLLALSILLIGSLHCDARLGETVAELEARYGKPLGTQKPTLAAFERRIVYSFRGMKIAVEFIGGKAATESYKSDTKDPLSKADFEAALEVNKGTSSWELNKTYADGVAEWKRKDGQGEAVRYPDRGFFILSAEAAKHFDKVEKTRGF